VVVRNNQDLESETETDRDRQTHCEENVKSRFFLLEVSVLVAHRFKLLRLSFDINSIAPNRLQSSTMTSPDIADRQWDIVRQAFPSLYLPAQRSRHWEKLIEFHPTITRLYVCVTFTLSLCKCFSYVGMTD
jgi:hypothetical protein